MWLIEDTFAACLQVLLSGFHSVQLQTVPKTAISQCEPCYNASLATHYKFTTLLLKWTLFFFLSPVPPPFFPFLSLSFTGMPIVWCSFYRFTHFFFIFLPILNYINICFIYISIYLYIFICIYIYITPASPSI